MAKKITSNTELVAEVVKLKAQKRSAKQIVERMAKKGHTLTVEDVATIVEFDAKKDEVTIPAKPLAEQLKDNPTAEANAKTWDAVTPKAKGKKAPKVSPPPAQTDDAKVIPLSMSDMTGKTTPETVAEKKAKKAPKADKSEDVKSEAIAAVAAVTGKTVEEVEAKVEEVEAKAYAAETDSGEVKVYNLPGTDKYARMPAEVAGVKNAARKAKGKEKLWEVFTGKLPKDAEVKDYATPGSPLTIRQTILRIMAGLDKSSTPLTVATTAGLPVKPVEHELRACLSDELVKSTMAGFYKLTDAGQEVVKALPADAVAATVKAKRVSVGESVKKEKKETSTGTGKGERRELWNGLAMTAFIRLVANRKPLMGWRGVAKVCELAGFNPFEATVKTQQKLGRKGEKIPGNIPSDVLGQVKGFIATAEEEAAAESEK